MQNGGASFIRVVERTPTDTLVMSIQYMKVQASPQFIDHSTETSPVSSGAEIRSIQDEDSSKHAVSSIEGFQGSRRDLLRYGSLAAAVGCILFTINNWKLLNSAGNAVCIP